MSVWAIVLAGGSGSRYGGDSPKQYESLLGRRVLDWSIEAAHATCDGVVLVVAEDFLARDEPDADVVVQGGDTRSGSVRAGLGVVPADADIVVVHDSARPLAGVALFDAVIEGVLAGGDAAVPAVPLTDTLKRLDDAGRVIETLDRDEVVAVQTPQAFRADVLREAHTGEPEATDDSALVEDIDGTVLVVPGDPRNLKITFTHDLRVAELYLS
jgi:2-C-methyl-D-erythritol 4-phosphate cytidylyltransferase